MINVKVPKFHKPGIIRDQQGFTLIEVLAAIVITSILSLSIYMALSTSTRVLVLTNTQEVAKDIASSDMEYIRSIPFADNYVILTSSNTSATVGDSVTFMVNVTYPTATDTVTFYDGASTLGTGNLSLGQTTLTTSALTAGSHNITAVYSGITSTVLTEIINATPPATSALAAKNSNYIASINVTYLRFNEQRIDITIRWGGKVVFSLTDFRVNY
jgi:prepilin-type N-terminal cleavage/methylation domain-containing protein